MPDPVTLGVAILAAFFGYLAGAMQGIGALERQWKAGYLAGARATRWAITRAQFPDGGDHG